MLFLNINSFKKYFSLNIFRHRWSSGACRLPLAESEFFAKLFLAQQDRRASFILENFFDMSLGIRWNTHRHTNKLHKNVSYVCLYTKREVYWILKSHKFCIVSLFVKFCFFALLLAALLVQWSCVTLVTTLSYSWDFDILFRSVCVCVCVFGFVALLLCSTF